MRNKEGGFSLLEVLLAILLLGTGLAFLLQVVSAGLFAGGQNEDEIVATYLAQEKIEELRNYSSIASISPGTEPAVQYFPAFSRQVAVDKTTQQNLAIITVTVSWYGGKPIVMVTYVSNL